MEPVYVYYLALIVQRLDNDELWLGDHTGFLFTIEEFVQDTVNELSAIVFEPHQEDEYAKAYGRLLTLVNGDDKLIDIIERITNAEKEVSFQPVHDRLRRLLVNEMVKVARTPKGVSL